jgi:hypothetical protein
MTDQDNLSRALQLLAAGRLDEARIYLEELRALARKGLREIAVRELKARGPRMDVVFYLLGAMRLFPADRRWDNHF